MTVRPYLALAVATGIALAVAPVHAATAVACKQLQDPAGDASVAGPTPSADSLDILSGDIATGTKNMVVVLRLASLNAEPATAAGALYEVSWKVAGVAQRVSLSIASDGTQSSVFTSDTSFGSAAKAVDVTATVDKATASITWAFKRATNPVLKSTARAQVAKLTGLAASARPSVIVHDPGDVSLTFLNGDSASGGRSYLDKAPSCVKGT